MSVLGTEEEDAIEMDLDTRLDLGRCVIRHTNSRWPGSLPMGGAGAMLGPFSLLLAVFGQGCRQSLGGLLFSQPNKLCHNDGRARKALFRRRPVADEDHALIGPDFCERSLLSN